ncbi:hypothetical protein JYU34_015556 [Plutella xylostella]|uniref:Uncharacterized protein n=1 Tax=Plutella xylostella TaxID=51655 RepID=A0ABQ7Q5P1_PLUXY|nr:hypothetical protein JYU34_015556 [Plutella xylostella]
MLRRTAVAIGARVRDTWRHVRAAERGRDTGARAPRPPRRAQCPRAATILRSKGGGLRRRRRRRRPHSAPDRAPTARPGSHSTHHLSPGAVLGTHTHSSRRITFICMLDEGKILIS